MYASTFMYHHNNHIDPSRPSSFFQWRASMFVICRLQPLMSVIQSTVLQFPYMIISELLIFFSIEHISNIMYIVSVLFLNHINPQNIKYKSRLYLYNDARIAQRAVTKFWPPQKFFEFLPSLNYLIIRREN